MKELRRLQEEDRSLGFFIFGPIANPKKNYPVEVHMSYSLDGVVRCRAFDGRTGEEVERIYQDGAGGADGNLGAQKVLVDSVTIAG